MRHRFFIPHVLTAGTVSLEGDELHHARVVRVRDGEEVEVFDGRGGGWIAIVRDGTSLELVKPIDALRESPFAIHLAMAIIQLEKFEFVLQKATELGARSIIPLVTDRCEVRPERYRGKSERWQKIVFEAVKQSGRTLVPTVETPATFAELAQRRATKIVFDADAEETPLPDTVDDAILFIGPEGGWSDGELASAREHGFVFRRMGPRRLRAETAAIVATAVIAARFGDLKSGAPEQKHG